MTDDMNDRPVTLTPCGNIVCTGCRICGCPALGIAPQEARDDEHEFLRSHPTNGAPVTSPAPREARDDEREALAYVIALNENAEEQFSRGVESAHGYDEASFIAGVRWALARKHPEPEITEAVAACTALIEQAVEDAESIDGEWGQGRKYPALLADGETGVIERARAAVAALQGLVIQ